MKIRLLRSNSADGKQSVRTAAQLAKVCYSQEPFDRLCNEDCETSWQRGQMLLKSGHHSPFEHIYFTFVFEEIPKILAMILNNEKVYATSEKSARYTQMKVDGPEADFYAKWKDILSKKIFEEYPNLPEGKILTLAQENARYGISIFAPATTMVHSINLRQLNYVLSYMEDYIKNCKQSTFNDMLVPVLREFCTQLADYRVPGLEEKKNYSLSLFSQRKRGNQWGDVYSFNYKGSFAQVAQAQRHRTLQYEIRVDEPAQARFYIPAIIKEDNALRTEWIKDMQSVSHLFPQGMLVEVNERGTLENFIRKCFERLCGHAQHEIMLQTKQTLKAYGSGTSATRPFILRELIPYSEGPRCTFGFKCKSPCYWGPEGAFSRKV